MDREVEARVNWRAVIVPVNGERPVHGRLSKLAKGKATVRTDNNLMPGHRCNLALMLPKQSHGAPNRFVEGRGIVVLSVVSGMQFHITVKWDEIEANGEALLNEHIRMHGQTWKTPM